MSNETLMMLMVDVDFGNDIIPSVPINDRSGFLYNHYQEFVRDIEESDSREVPPSVDINRLLSSVDVEYRQHYFFFLRKYKNNNILTVKQMLNSFNIYSIVGDDNYFDFLIGQLLDNWSSLSFAVLLTNHNTQRDIFLHIPYQLIPEHVTNNEVFVREWLRLNGGKPITVNKLEIYTYIYNVSGKDFELVYKNRISGVDIQTRHEFHDNGNKSLVSTIRNGKFNGEFKRWLENGKLAEQGTYVDGVQEGLWTEWVISDDNEQEHIHSRQGVYVHGKATGLWTVWWLGTNIISAETHYSANRHNGTTVNYYSNGKKRQEEYYSNDILHGESKKWYPTGKLKSETEYYKGQLDGKYTEYYNDELHTPKTIGYYKKGNKVGLWRHFDDNGDLTNEMYHTT